jgi:hypothetical protein
VLVAVAEVTERLVGKKIVVTAEKAEKIAVND